MLRGWQGGGGGVQKFRASKGAPLHGAKPASRFKRFKRRCAASRMHLGDMSTHHAVLYTFLLCLGFAAIYYWRRATMQSGVVIVQIHSAH